MLIGYIEQEILEGKFWYFWQYSYQNEMKPVDLQSDEDDDEQEITKLTNRSQPIGTRSSSRPLDQNSQR